jgi:hypothetical protein
MAIGTARNALFGGRFCLVFASGKIGVSPMKNGSFSLTTRLARP